MTEQDQVKVLVGGLVGLVVFVVLLGCFLALYFKFFAFMDGKTAADRWLNWVSLAGIGAVSLALACWAGVAVGRLTPATDKEEAARKGQVEARALLWLRTPPAGVTSDQATWGASRVEFRGPLLSEVYRPGWVTVKKVPVDVPAGHRYEAALPVWFEGTEGGTRGWFAGQLTLTITKPLEGEAWEVREYRFQHRRPLLLRHRIATWINLVWVTLFLALLYLFFKGAAWKNRHLLFGCGLLGCLFATAWGIHCAYLCLCTPGWVTLCSLFTVATMAVVAGMFYYMLYLPTRKNPFSGPATYLFIASTLSAFVMFFL